MHIVIIADPLDKQSAGVFYYAKNLILSLLDIDKKNTYSIIKLNAREISENIQSIPLKNTFTFLHDDPYRTFITLPKLIKKLKPDVVVELAHFGPFNLPKTIKRVTIIHDLTPIKFPQYHKFYSQFLQKLFLPGIVKKADLLITNSKNTSLDLQHYYPKSKGKTETIHLGKSEGFKPSFSKNILKQHKISKPYFFTVGTIEPRKNLITLLEAYKLFRQKNETEIELIISGGIGWKSKEFFKNYFNHPFKDDIKLIGYASRQHLPYLYSHAEAFVFPSLYEGFGLPIVEAMACGTACIVSNTSSIPEVCEDAAIYFNPNSSEELSEKMEQIANNKELQREFMEKSMIQAKKFSWEIHAKEFIRLMETYFS